MIMASHAPRTPSPSRRYASSRNRANPRPTGSWCAPSAGTSVYSMILPRSVAFRLGAGQAVRPDRDRPPLVAELAVPVWSRAGRWASRQVFHRGQVRAGRRARRARAPGFPVPRAGRATVDRNHRRGKAGHRGNRPVPQCRPGRARRRVTARGWAAGMPATAVARGLIGWPCSRGGIRRGGGSTSRAGPPRCGRAGRGRGSRSIRS